MKVIYAAGQIKKFKKPVLAIGIFDGLHLGHKLLIRKTVKKALRIKGTSVVLTFYPHPNHILNSDKNLTLLVSLKHRLKLIESLGVDVCMVVDFTKGFSGLSADEFVKKFIVKKISPREIFVGQNFTFGKNRSGNTRLLKRLGNFYNFRTREIAPLRISGKIVSSTLIRALIKKGSLTKAGLFLGRPVSILGRVVRGKGLGRILGYPTANISIVNEAAPPSGVYAVKVIINKRKLFGMAYLRENLEVHIFDFKNNLYSKEIEVEFYRKIRPVKRFKQQSSLRKQIKEDQNSIKKFFQSPKTHHI